MNIKAICFDLDGVYFTPAGKESFHTALCEEFGATEAARNAFMFGGEAMQALVTGKITPVEFWNRLRAELSINASDEVLTTRWVRDYKIDEQVRRAVASARTQGFITCVCTNNNVIRLPALEEKFGFMSDFDHIVSSHEVGYTKPSKEIFEALLGRVGVAPEALIYSDDNPQRIVGAQELGINTFVYEHFEQFLAELSKRNITL